MPGADERKNWRGLIDAFALLPKEVRETHQLVIGCGMTDDYRERVLNHARTRGVVDRLVLAGELTDQPLRLFYQHCAVFCFPSFYEGFGLPIIERSLAARRSWRRITRRNPKWSATPVCSRMPTIRPTLPPNWRAF